MMWIWFILPILKHMFRYRQTVRSYAKHFTPGRAADHLMWASAAISEARLACFKKPTPELGCCLNLRLQARVDELNRPPMAGDCSGGGGVPMPKLDNKIALITGSDSGMGQAMAE